MIEALSSCQLTDREPGTGLRPNFHLVIRIAHADARGGRPLRRAVQGGWDLIFSLMHVLTGGFGSDLDCRLPMHAFKA